MSVLPTALQQKILPAITFHSAEHALPVAEALLTAGLNVMEVPLRTGEALEAIETIRKYYPDMYIGAGTILNAGQLQSAINAGAQFGLAPGLNQKVCEGAISAAFPFIPGVMTPSDIELAYELGYTIVKLFPAGQVGGMGYLKAMQGPYGQLGMQFIPMGGVNLQNMAGYLALKNVIAVGGSWLAAKELMDKGNYTQIKYNVTDALKEAVQP